MHERGRASRALAVVAALALGAQAAAQTRIDPRFDSTDLEPAPENVAQSAPKLRFRLLEEIRDSTSVDLLLKPGRVREEAGQVRFVSALQHTAGDVSQAFVVQDDQARQIVLEMLKLAPILEEVPEDARMRSHQGSGSHDWKLHQALPLSREGV